MCYRCAADDTPVRRPRKDKPDIDLLNNYLNQLLDLCGLPREDKWSDALDVLEDWGDQHDPDLKRSIDALGNKEGGAGIPQTWFDQRLNTLKALLMEQFPKSVVDKILPSSEGKGGNYKIQLSPTNITPIESKIV